jgi:cytochrome P450
MKHVLHSAGYHYPKSAERAQLIKVAAGNGLIAAQGLYSLETVVIATHGHNCTGQAHHRQRKMMSPAFSPVQVQSFLPLLHSTASKVCHFSLSLGVCVTILSHVACSKVKRSNRRRPV